MSYSVANYNNVEPNENEQNSFSNIDAAFAQSSTMNNFQNQMMSHNPLTSQGLVNNSFNAEPLQEGNINISAQSEEKIDSKVDEIVGNFYDQNKQFNNTNTNTEFIENFNLQQDTQNALNNTNATSYRCTGMSFFKLVLLLVLLGLLVYAGYLLYSGKYTNGSTLVTKSSGQSVLTPPSPGNIKLIERIIR